MNCVCEMVFNAFNLTGPVDFRKLQEAILKHSSKAALDDCVGEIDAHGETLLHVCARSKASGLSRLFIQTQAAAAAAGVRPGTEAYKRFSTPALKLLSLKLPRDLSSVRMSAAVSSDDLDAVLVNSSSSSFPAPNYRLSR